MFVLGLAGIMLSWMYVIGLEQTEAFIAPSTAFAENCVVEFEPTVMSIVNAPDAAGVVAAAAPEQVAFAKIWIDVPASAEPLTVGVVSVFDAAIGLRFGAFGAFESSV